MTPDDMSWLFQILLSFACGLLVGILVAGWIFLPRRRFSYPDPTDFEGDETDAPRS